MHQQRGGSYDEAIYWIYDPLLFGFFLAQLPLFLTEYFTTNKYREDLKQRFGYYSPEVRQQFCLGKTAWVHAVSVGEVVAVTPLIKDLMARHPELLVNISTVTRTGREMVKKSFHSLNKSLFLPFDFRFITERVIEQMYPRFLLLTETEIWPNLIRSASRRNVPVMIMNGRVSSRSYKHYSLVKGLLRSVLSRFSVFAMQSGRDADRIISLGADPRRVFVTGNCKFDQAKTKISKSERNQIAVKLGLSPETLVLMAGSTHKGEEKLIIETYKRLLVYFQNLVLFIAPRYLPEIPDIVVKCNQEGLFSERKSRFWEGKSQKSPASKAGRVIILDTIGELSKMYSLATLVFVGGSLVPVGGHNLLEPAMYGKPVVFGPYMDNFQEISRLLKEHGGGFEVRDKNELEDRVKILLQDRDLRTISGEAALRAVEENRGATRKTLELIETHLL